MNVPQLNFAPYRDVRRSILDSDLLLFRRRGLISIAGRGEHSHAAKAAWWHNDLSVKLCYAGDAKPGERVYGHAFPAAAPNATLDDPKM
ncbi:MAG TPA: hypothetical protein VL175_00465 [Pirellulales bacterium]|jgi:hypothetical protein|nr:hypothetical protein [Pirellulales bacterium]